MPKYKYECDNCKIEFDYFIVKSDDKPECPKCEEKEKIKRLFSSRGDFVLKGRGWFKGGYK